VPADLSALGNASIHSTGGGRPSLERVFDGSRNAMLIADDARRYTAANDSACLLLETPRERLLTLSIDNFTPIAMLDELDQRWRDFLDAGTQAGAYTLQLPSGRRLEIEYSATANIGVGQHLSIFLSPSLGIERERVPVEALADRLTAREREVLGLVALGSTTPDIAERLTVSPETVRSHVKHAIEKLQARNRAHAVLLAIRSDQIDV
jgi:DNA-binding CsgD family transcriptional regulator